MLKGKLPSEVVNERHQQVNAMKQFVQEQKQKLQEVLEHLGLTEESLSKVQLKQICPHNSNHIVPEKSFKKHVEKCRLRKAGCQEDELPSQLQNTDFCYEGKNSMKIELDESLMNKIIWDECVQSGEVYTGHRTMLVSHIDENINLTQNDRLAVHRYVVNKSHEAGKVIQVDKTDELLTTDWGSLVKKGLLDAQNNDNYSSKLEQLAALRDMKRRRQSYRAKNVHITKKSYTEIIKEVILNQMELLVPASSSKKHIKESDSEEHKLKTRDRKRGERDRNDDRDSHSRRKSRNREKRRRLNDGDGHENDDAGSVRSVVSELQSQPTKCDDLEFVKKEPIENVNADSVNNEGSDLTIASPCREEIEGNSGTNISNETKRNRSQSCSSSLSSGEERHPHHKKSKHKKKSKRSKKHSKKHKRSDRENVDN